MSRTKAATALLSLAWALVRYAQLVAKADASPSDKHRKAEQRWLAICHKRWGEYLELRDQWRSN